MISTPYFSLALLAKVSILAVISLVMWRQLFSQLVKGFDRMLIEFNQLFLTFEHNY